MIHHELITDRGILIVKPEGRLEKADFDRLKQVVDPFIEATGELRSLSRGGTTSRHWRAISSSSGSTIGA